MDLAFKKPDIALRELKQKYNCNRTHLLKEKLRKPASKNDRELFYGALFAESLNKITSHEYLIRMPEKDEDCDCELLDYSEWQSNQNRSKEQKQSDHFLLQNVQITEHVVSEALKKDKNNIYDIFREHLVRTKLSTQTGDYSGCILIFYMGLKIDGQIGLQELRKMVKESNQNKFQQIWVIIPNHNQYGIAELCQSQEQFKIAIFED